MTRSRNITGPSEGMDPYSPEKYPSEGSAISGLGYAAFSAMFIITWISPYTFGLKTVSYLTMMMLLEFIVMHSGAFLATAMAANVSRGKKSLNILGIGLFYSLFILGISLSFSDWLPALIFAGMIANRVITVLTAEAGEVRKSAANHSWAASALFYLLFVFATTLLPVPELGITSDVARAQEFTSSGLWVDEPQRVVAFGFLYFGALALSELSGYRWMIKMAGKKPGG
ncbi:MAG: hypothetical protein HY751_13580 [Nitrospinae bacterium]|nr:hypothetical protein [Nitrospinota bacterium]